ncbi:MAG: HupE/UreJ family protein [Pseudomonadota bacterium]|nr:MAG: HupE/UreJ family protein [Pseudomonadota bacterium]
MGIVAVQPLYAHTIGASGGFSTGLAHPLLGWDHMLAMLAVGVWAAELGGRSVWKVPAAFLIAMALGAGIAVAGLPLFGVEGWIATSILVLGLLIAAPKGVSGGIAAGIVATFALFHGHAHGAGLALSASPLAYFAGFMLTTVCLHLTGIGAGRALRSSRQDIIRAGGIVLAAAGAWLVFAA